MSHDGVAVVIRPLLALVAPLCLSCVEPAARAPRAAVPIKSACTAGSRSAAAVGIEVRQGRRHSESRTLFVKNVGDRPRDLRVVRVGRVEGPCDGEWARQTELDFLDADTGAVPGRGTLLPEQEIQIQIGTQGAASTWSCAKLGLSLWLSVDDVEVCADGGAFIADRGAVE